MTVGILKIALFIPSSNSLKEKRRVMLSLCDLLRNRFNISLAQIDAQDKWQRSVVAIACVATKRPFVDRAISKIIDFIRDFNQVELIDYEVELI
ncbi:MAG: DUF503 domain-containing protein [Candidatus Omnitrophota bacterium]|nr:DUF503 domain-containing protein [Candidatus Omnitrophota bacterium]